MSDKMKTLLAKVAEDETLQARFKACKSIPEQVDLAKQLGFEVTSDEFEKATKLSDDQLDEVAGGSCTVNIFG
jgi:predicted ribosomally synthesized peptide with nif11-like leader